MEYPGYHILFPEDYLSNIARFTTRKHATWSLTPIEGIIFKFGGKLNSQLNRLISFETDFDIHGCSLKGETFAINFEDFFNAQLSDKHLFYQHLENGKLEQLTKGIKIECAYSNHPLLETKIKLALTPEEFLNQTWEGNCNRVGGNPIWVQEPENLSCPNCQSKMTYLFQLDSGLPDLNERNANEIMFGNDGMCYAFWCDQDKISGYLWQST